MERRALIIQHDVIGARDAHDEVHACDTEQREQRIHIVLVRFGVVGVTDIAAHGQTEEFAAEVIFKTGTDDLLAVVEILRSDEPDDGVDEKRVELACHGIAAGFAGLLIHAMMGVRGKRTSLPCFEVHDVVAECAPLEAQGGILCLAQQRERDAKALVGRFCSTDRLEREIDRRTGFHGGNGVGDMREYTGLRRNVKAQAKAVNQSQQLNDRGQVVTRGIDADHGISGTEHQAVQDGSSNAARVIRGMVRLESRGKGSRQSQRIAEARDDVAFSGHGNQVLVAHETSDGSGHLRSDCARDMLQNAGIRGVQEEPVAETANGEMPDVRKGLGIVLRNDEARHFIAFVWDDVLVEEVGQRKFGEYHACGHALLLRVRSEAGQRVAGALRRSLREYKAKTVEGEAGAGDGMRVDQQVSDRAPRLGRGWSNGSRLPCGGSTQRCAGFLLLHRFAMMREQTFQRGSIMVSKASAAAVLLVFSLLASNRNGSAQTAPIAKATLKLDLQAPRAKVSPTLYGLMTEEINFSYDGGLYAEMVRNRTFHDGRNEPAYWYLIQDGTAQASITMDPMNGPSDALPMSLRLDIKNADANNQAGVLNEGYWGYALQPHTVYKGSLYAKANGEMGSLSVDLVNDDSNKVVAAAKVPAITSSWARYSYQLTTGNITASSHNHLALKFEHAGTAWIDLVSLFPPTYHDRVNGNRVDLMEKLAAMKPSFLRFPGGNYLEGDDIWDRYEWKTTIGPLVDRPTHPSPWRYHSSDGLGLLEFFEWCEDLHMRPLLAVYAGYSMKQEHIEPGPKLEPYVQDALDEIEYATGGADTKWGGIRIKDGHPQPFHLDYVEIGNEDWFDRSGSYEGRFAQFYKAIKAKYPQLQLIATMPLKGTKPDVVDDHYYKRASQFYDDVHHYDSTDRNGPKIFVGEWATREGTPTPNFGAALGDAAWMTGMERNSDLIVMAAYAPLLVNVNPGGMQWETDLIGYDAMHSYGSPSYYAQVMFDSYLGQEIVKGDWTGENKRCFYSATYSPDRGTLYLKLVNASSVAQPLALDISGAGRVQSSGKLIRLSASGTQETNSLADPERIKPVESTLTGVSGNFEHVVPPYSIEVLVLETR